MKTLAPILACIVSIAHADLVITEVMPKSAHTGTAVDGDWWELTNTGSSAVNLAGYTWDDTPTPLLPSISYFPNVTIQPGESIIILQEAVANVATWKTAWGLGSTQVLSRELFVGGESFSGLGEAGDEVNVYDPFGNLVAHAEFGTVPAGQSAAFLRDGTPIYGLTSSVGEHGAVSSTQSPADIGSPGDARIHFRSPPTIYGMSSYSYSVNATAPGAATPTISALTVPSFLTLTPGATGKAVLASNRALTLADAGNHLVRLLASNGSTSTVQEFLVTVLNPSPSVILNEYNAVSAANFLNGGTLTSDDDGGALSSDAYFGRIAGNGGPWVEFAVVGNGGVGTLDLRGWKIQIGRNLGSGFVAQNTLVLSNHANWQAIPTGTLLTFTANNTSQGGLDSGFAIRDRRSTLGDTWTNIWMGDPTFLTYTNSTVNGFVLSGGIVSGISIDNSGTQFRVVDAANRIVCGPVGEGVAPLSGTSSREVFELENHPSPAISPIVASSPSVQGYGDGATDSTFGSPNRWLEGAGTAVQSFLPYSTDGYAQWTVAKGLSGSSAQASADPDGDGRDNLQEYAFGGHPSLHDAAYPASAPLAGPVVSWTYVRRGNDPALVFGHEASLNLAQWSSVAVLGTATAPFGADPAYSTVTVTFSRPVPAPGKWFLRAKAE